MPTEEYWAGVTGDQDRRVMRYLIDDATDEVDALNKAEIDLPAGRDGLWRDNIKVREYSKKDNLYEVVGIYTRRSYDKPAPSSNTAPVNVTGPSEPTETDPDKEIYSFDIGLENKLEYFPRNKNILSGVGGGNNPGGFPETADGQKIAVVVGEESPGNDYEAIDFAGFDFDPEFGFRGVQLPRPKQMFSLTITPDDTKVDRAYENFVENTVGKVNSTRFRGHEPGHVMLMSARGEGRNSNDWQFTFTFEVRRPQTNIDLGNGVQIGSVAGWDRIEPYWVWRVVDFGGTPVTMRVCWQATIWRDYSVEDFAGLII